MPLVNKSVILGRARSSNLEAVILSERSESKNPETARRTDTVHHFSTSMPKLLVRYPHPHVNDRLQRRPQIHAPQRPRSARIPRRRQRRRLLRPQDLHRRSAVVRHLPRARAPGPHPHRAHQQLRSPHRRRAHPRAATAGPHHPLAAVSAGQRRTLRGRDEHIRRRNHRTNQPAGRVRRFRLVDA